MHNINVLMEPPLMTTGHLGPTTGWIKTLCISGMMYVNRAAKRSSERARR